MGIKTFETRNSLKNKLHSRNLIFSENELDEILKNEAKESKNDVEFKKVSLFDDEDFK